MIDALVRMKKAFAQPLDALFVSGLTLTSMSCSPHR